MLKRFSLIAALLLSGALALAQEPDHRAHHQQLARAAIAFLDRTQLTGAEAEMMFHVRALLTAVALGQMEITAAPKKDK